MIYDRIDTVDIAPANEEVFHQLALSFHTHFTSILINSNIFKELSEILIVTN